MRAFSCRFRFLVLAVFGSACVDLGRPPNLGVLIDAAAGSTEGGLEAAAERSQDLGSGNWCGPTLVVGGADAQSRRWDTFLESRLRSWGCTPTFVSNEAVTDADAAGRSLVVVSESGLSVSLGTKLRNVRVPLIVFETGALMGLGMISGQGKGDVPGTDLLITMPQHPLAGGLAGPVAITSRTGTLSYGIPAPAANVIGVAPDDPTHPVYFGYETGAAMAGLNAPARRVYLGDDAVSFENMPPSGWLLIEAAARWAVSPPP